MEEAVLVVERLEFTTLNQQRWDVPAWCATNVAGALPGAAAEAVACGTARE